MYTLPTQQGHGCHLSLLNIGPTRATVSTDSGTYSVPVSCSGLGSGDSGWCTTCRDPEVNVELLESCSHHTPSKPQ